MIRTASPLESVASNASYESATASEASTMSTEPAVNLDDLDINSLLAAAKQSLTTRKVETPKKSKTQKSDNLDSISFDESDYEEQDDDVQKEEDDEEDEDPTLTEIKKTISQIPKLSDTTSQFKVKPRLSSIPEAISKNTADNLNFRIISDPVQLKRAAKEKRESTAGDKWFNMPKAELTPELKRDLQLLQMRHVLDPKRHYKKNTFGISKQDAQDSENGGFPKFVQKGTIVEDSSEFFSARLTKKQRKKTFAQELLADDKTKTYFKRKYGEIMEEKNKTRGNRRRKY